jgi:MFS family permease
VILARRALPGRAPSPGAGGFDALGIVVLIALLSALVLGMTGLIDNWTGLRLAPGLLALTIPLGWVFVAVERRAQRPMVPLSLFARRRLALSYLLSCGAGFGMGAVAFLTSVTQLTHGVAVRHGGFALLPLVLCSMAGSVVAGRRLNQIGPRPLIVVGFALLTLGYIGIATGTFGLPGFLMYSAAVGLGVGVVVSGALRTIALEDAPAAQRGAAQGLVNLSSSVGTLVSAAAIGALADFNGGGARGFEVAYLVVGLAMVAMILIGLALPERSPPAHDDRDPLLGTPVPEASRGQ